MIASIIPGLRQVRAPLAAGFLWLIALWFLLEPSWLSLEADLLDSANRLLATISLLGQGIAISFAAYILGSFSVFVFSRPLAGLIRTSITERAYLTGLSQLARISLHQVAIDGRKRMEDALALSGRSVDEILGLSAPVVDTRSKRAPEARHGVESEKVLRADTVLPTPEERQEREISVRVLRDIPQIANSQLLGQHPAVYSAVDRGEADFEFRIALVPALTALAGSIAVRLVAAQPVIAAIVLAVGLLSAAGLLLDAARRRRDTNELILSLMEHGRITAPSVLRAESAATALADQAPAKVLARQAEEASRAIRRYLAALDAVPASGSVLMLSQAHDGSRRAHQEGERLEHLLRQYELPTDDRRRAPDVLAPLDRALSSWSAMNAAIQVPSPAVPPWNVAASPPDGDEMLREVRRGRELFEEFVNGIRTIVSRVAAGDAARAAVPGGDTTDALVPLENVTNPSARPDTPR